MKDLVIRPASEKDIPAIFTLIKELAVYEKLIDSLSVTEELLAENLFRKRYAEVLIAEYNNELSGQALFFHNFSTFVGKPGIYLEDIYVRPQFRGKGIGKSMLMYLIELARERGCGRVEWTVLDWNESAIQFYKNLGAVQMDDWRIFRITI